MKQIRLHGRGGQGVVMAGEMLAASFAFEGKYAAVIPTFGFERRGAPVHASLRVDDNPIREKTQVYEVDALMALDPVLALKQSVFKGLRSGGICLLNRMEPLKSCPHENLLRVGVVDATGIAMEEIGAPIPNTCMVGAFAAFTGWVTLDSVLETLEETFSGKRIEKNLRAAQRGFTEITINEYTAVLDQ